MTLPLLLQAQHTALPAQAFLTRAGDTAPQEIEKASPLTRAWFVTSGGQPYFVKWAETAGYDALLAKDVEICTQNLHPAIVRVRNVVRSVDGVLVVFERVDGEALADAPRRARFFDLAPSTKLAALRSLFEALAAIADQGWVLVDFYEGNVIYDYATGTLKTFDFELFERGSGFTLQRERNYGSSRLMAPEEFRRGSWIDQASNVFTLGRYAIHALSPDPKVDWRGGFQANDGLAAVLDRATQPDRRARYPTVRAFVTAFTGAV